MTRTESGFCPKTIMLAASTKCQSSCKYCFMPQDGGIMDLGVLKDTLAFLDALLPKCHVFTIIFHGNEPMLAGLEWYKTALPLIRKVFGHNVKLRMQSNIWLLDEQWADLFDEYGVTLSTSLDGPREMCDSQRGEGYFDNTMRGINLLRERGCEVGVVATVAKSNATQDKCREMFRFFYNKGVSFNLHGAVPSLGAGFTEEVLSADEMFTVLKSVADEYFKDVSKISVGTIDDMVKGVYSKKSTLCTFYDCLGTYLAVAPDGYLYSCQRFCGMREYSLGTIYDDAEKITKSAGYCAVSDLHSEQRRTCENAECHHAEYCGGGCCYTTLAAKKHGGGKVCDPFCDAFRKFYDYLNDRLTNEMADALMNNDSPKPLLAIAERKRVKDFTEINKMNIAKLSAMTTLPRQMAVGALDTVFLNITYNCPLLCSHCSANAGLTGSVEMSADVVIKTISGAFSTGFENVVITGGEPMFHKNFGDILVRLAAYRHTNRTPRLILQTSLTSPLSEETIVLIGECFDQVNVSIDGEEREHDERRGAGSFTKTIGNLTLFLEKSPKTRVLITAALSRSQINGDTAKGIKNLSRKLGGLPVRFAELKELGRYCGDDVSYAETLNVDSILSQKKLVFRRYCGLGRHLHIEPSGKIYPCYAFVDAETELGNISAHDSLCEVVASEKYQGIRRQSVDTDANCAKCDMRYLCGGVCKTKRSCDYERHYFTVMRDSAVSQK